MLEKIGAMHTEFYRVEIRIFCIKQPQCRTLKSVRVY